jgi:GNAT superfamily N-acetyltransferase
MQRRDVRDEDSAALIALIAECWAAYDGVVLDVDGEEPWLRRPAAAYEEWGGAMWVRESEPGDVIACIGWKPHDDAVELKSLYVHPSARRRGLGAQLIDLVEAVAAERGATTVRLWSDTRFVDAHRLYERRGYDRTGRTRELNDLSATTEYEFRKRL